MTKMFSGIKHKKVNLNKKFLTAGSRLHEVCQMLNTYIIHHGTIERWHPIVVAMGDRICEYNDATMLWKLRRDMRKKKGKK